LKPGNIMLAPTGAKLLDFGLAKPAGPVAGLATLTGTPTQKSPVTEQGTIVGTFQYMSPEQIEGKELDSRSDIFSFGAVLYEMFTGKRAFEGKSQISVASAILEKDPAPITSVKPTRPPALDHAICRCLAKDPEQRWQTARDLALELKWIAEKGPQLGAPAPFVALGSIRGRLGWAGAALTALVLFGLALFVVGYFSHPTAQVQTVRASISPPSNAASLFRHPSRGQWPSLRMAGSWHSRRKQRGICRNFGCDRSIPWCRDRWPVRNMPSYPSGPRTASGLPFSPATGS